MKQFRFLTAGESHGKALVAILEGFPSGFSVNIGKIDSELHQRQQGAGRSGRMKIEKDAVQILSGVRDGKTLGSPVTLLVPNRDQNETQDLPRLEKPRPGHADLVGAIKHRHEDIRYTLERASARETAIRTAAGALCQDFLSQFRITFHSDVVQIGHAATHTAMAEEIQTAQKKGDTLGGLFDVRVQGLPLGLGSHTHWDLKLDGRVSQAVMSIPAIKGVEIGEGFNSAKFYGSEFQDEIFYAVDDTYKHQFGFHRKTNRSGGLEGGMTTGEELVIRAVMKPISTQNRQPLQTVNLYSKEPETAIKQRSDTCAVHAASIVARNVVAIELMCAFLEKFGGDSVDEIKRNYQSYLTGAF